MLSKISTDNYPQTPNVSDISWLSTVLDEDENDNSINHSDMSNETRRIIRVIYNALDKGTKDGGIIAVVKGNTGKIIIS